MMDSQIVPGGFLLKYYAARHSLGHYRSFGGTGSYTFPSSVLASPPHLTQLLQYALSKTISHHPTLAFGVVPQSEKHEAHFYRLTSINFQDVVTFRPATAAEGTEDEVLEKELGLAHRHSWDQQTQKPGWKIIVVSHSNEEREEGRVDIIFITHHALADGGSGAAFHKTLYSHLLEGLTLPSPTSEWPHKIPTTTKPPIAIEDAFPFPPTATLPPPSPTPDPESTPWSAPPPTFPVDDLALILTLPSPLVSKTLAFCRSTNITLTSLLHFLLLTHLSHTLPSTTASSFLAGTPYSLRKFSGLSDQEMVNHISSISTLFPPSLISLIRSLQPSDEGSEKEKEAMAKTGHQFQSQIKKELDFTEKEKYSPPLFAQAHTSKTLSTPSAIQKYHNAALTTPRKEAYEISNIGLVKVPSIPISLSPNPTPETQQTTPQIKLQSLIFSQCAMPFGAAIGCSVASLASGPLTICFSYQEGVVSTEFMRGLRDYVGRRLRGFGA